MADTNTDSNSGVIAALRLVVAAVEAVVEKIGDLIEWFLKLIPRLVESFFIMLKDVFLWCVEQILGLVSYLIDGISGFDSIIAAAGGIWSGIPPEALQVMQAIGLGTALGIIGTAILIRIALQLIPFVRLGS